MAGFKVWGRLAFSYSVSAFWGVVVTFSVIKLIIQKRGKFFSKKNRLTPPAILHDQLYGTHKYAAIDKSIKLHYVESGSPDKPLIVFVHGFPEFWYSWRNQIKEFQKDFRVIAIDMRGYGGSSKPSQVDQYSIDILAADIAKLIETVSPNKKCYLVAHDWGGMVSWIVGARYPHLLEKCVIINCPHVGAFNKFLQTSRKQFLRSWYVYFINLPYYPEWFFSAGDVMFIKNIFLDLKRKNLFTAEDEEAYKYTYNKKSDFTGPMNYYRCLVRRPSKGVLKERVTACPVLLIWGTEDKALSTELAEMCRPYADDFTLKYVQGATHFVQQEEAGTVNHYIRDFIGSRTQSNL